MVLVARGDGAAGPGADGASSEKYGGGGGLPASRRPTAHDPIMGPLPPRFLRRGCRPLAARWCTAFHSARGNWCQCFQSPLPLVALAAMVRWCLRGWACPQAARLLASCQRGCCGAEPLGHGGCRWRSCRGVPFCCWPPSGVDRPVCWPWGGDRTWRTTRPASHGGSSPL